MEQGFQGGITNIEGNNYVFKPFFYSNLFNVVILAFLFTYNTKVIVWIDTTEVKSKTYNYDSDKFTTVL